MNRLKRRTVVSIAALTATEQVIFSVKFPRFVPEPSKRPIPWSDTCCYCGLTALSGSTEMSFADAYGAAMIAEEVKSPDPEPSANKEETQPENSPQEDPDTARGEAFKRMFPDVHRKPPDRVKKPSG